jgi:ATP-dependent RNA helicase DeaD
MNFDEVQIKRELIEALVKINITKLTSIQEKTLPIILSGKNVFIHSETGTGKTFSYLLPVLNNIKTESDDLQAIILSPTHELSSQIVDNIKTIAEHSGTSYTVQLIIGETQIKRQKQRLKKKPHLIVGTPGRILELIKQKKIKVHQLNQLVSDEADKLFSGKFYDAMIQMIKASSNTTQFLFASASVEKEGVSNVFELCKDLELIETNDSVLSDNITHIFLEASKLEKKDMLRKFLLSTQNEKTLVFVHRNNVAEELYDFLLQKSVAVEKIHGDEGKDNRKNALSNFKKGKLSVLICSDIAARGLHIDDVENVVNYDVPSKKESYLHRAGRTARSGKTGHCLSFASRHELDYLQRIQDELDIDIYQVKMENGQVVSVEDE